MRTVLSVAGRCFVCYSTESHMRGQQKHRYAIKLAANAAITVLRVDQIIMAKQAGGPKPPAQGGPGDD